MKASEKCKICQLEKSHKSVFNSINKAVVDIEAGKLKKSMASVIRGINKKYGTELTPMNASRHKAHFLTETIEIKKEDVTKTPSIEIYSKEGELEYDIEEITEGLNPKHKMFCELYVNDCNRNGSKAYKEVYGTDNVEHTSRAGAWLIRTNKNNLLYIKHLTEIRREEIGVNENYVLETTKEVIERCMQAEPVFDKQGDPTGEWTFNANGANKALSELGKYLKMDKPKEETTDQIKYKQILEDLLNNKLNPFTAGIELGKAGLALPEVVKIAMTKIDSSILDKPAITDDMNLDDLTDDELDRLEIENDL